MIKKKINAGIYVIEIDGCEKFYIGSTLDLKRRRRDHERLLLKGTHKNLHLQNAFNKHGKDSYKFGIIAICEKDKDFLLDLEQKIIDSYDFNNLFNFNRFTRVTTKDNDIDYNYIKNVFKDTAGGIDRGEILKKYNLSKPNHYNIIIRRSYSWIEVDKDIVRKAQDTLRKCDKYSKKDLRFIKDNYKKGLKFLSENLGRTEVALNCQIIRMKINRADRLSVDERNEMIKLYLNGYKAKDLAIKFRCHIRTVFRIMLREAK